MPIKSRARKSKIDFSRKMKPLSPGAMYRNITVSRPEFDEGEGKLVKRGEHPYVVFCKRIHSMVPSLGNGAHYTGQYRNAINFLGWDLKAEQFAAATKFTLLAVIMLAFVVGTLTALSPLADLIGELAGGLAIVYIYGLPLAVGIYIASFVQNFPLTEVRMEQTRALTYVPEILGYMIMSMKLVPNLEKAVEFSAEHGRGKIAEDFKRMLWDVQLGVFSSLSEGLDDLAYRWGNNSEEFKHALMMIRASVLENTEAKRYQLLDKTMTSILESIKSKMEDYARNLSQPSVMLFYLGVLLPLILIIILPVGSAFTGQGFAVTWVLFLLYNVLIPGAVLFFARKVVSEKPPTRSPPEIPDNHPDLPPKWMIRTKNFSMDARVFAGIVLVIGLMVSLFLSAEGIPPKSFFGEDGFSGQLLPADKSRDDILLMEKNDSAYFDKGGQAYQQYISQGLDAEIAWQKTEDEAFIFFMTPANDTTPYNLIFGMLLTSSLCGFVLIYFRNIYKRKVQVEVMEMESEFKDSLYVLASRLGENKPVEEALRHTREFLPTLTISEKIFGRAYDNISLFGMTLENAVFDSQYGVLKDIPSEGIRSGMKLLIDSVRLGVNVASRTLISLSLQLSNTEKVQRMLKVLVSDVTSMMKTMTMFIAPIVLGITAAFQKIVMLTVAQISMQSPSSALSTAKDLPAEFASFDQMDQVFGGGVESLKSLASPAEFLIIVAIYVLELVIIMSWFTTRIEEDNSLLAKINIAKSMPIAVGAFLLAVVATNFIVSSFFGGGFA